MAKKYSSPVEGPALGSGSAPAEPSPYTPTPPAQQGQQTSTNANESGNESTKVQSEDINPTINLTPTEIKKTKKSSTRPVSNNIEDPRDIYKDPRGPRDEEEDIEARDETIDDSTTGNPYIIKNEDNAIEVLPTAKEIFYNTVSCPCSTYLIKDSSNNIGCEREYYGVKQYFKPLKRTNHFIEDRTPNLGDKWKCEDKTCEQSGYVFDGFYIVHVEENKSAPSSSIVNSTRFTDNCFIPKARYFHDYNKSISKELENIFKEDQVTTINGVPIFTHESIAIMYSNYVDNEKSDFTYWYNSNGIKGWVATDVLINDSTINGFWFKNKNLLKIATALDFQDALSTASYSGKTTVNTNGETVIIRINGLNSPAFSLTIKDSSGNSILEDQIRHVQLNDSGEYILEQRFPPITRGKDSETYDLTFTPVAYTKYYYANRLFNPNPIRHKIWQFKSPTVTIKAGTCSDCGTHSNSATDITYSGQPFSSISSTKTHTTTITRTSGTVKYYLSDNINFNNSIIAGDVIKKYIYADFNQKNIKSVNEIYVRDVSDTTYAGDIEAGMTVFGEITKTKTILKVVPIELFPDEDNIRKTEDKLIKTNKFEVDYTYDLFEGMRVIHNNFESYIISIDCEKSITIAHKYILHQGENLTFKHQLHAEVAHVGEYSERGYKVLLDGQIYAPHNTELIFRKRRRSTISGSIKVDKQGSDKIVVTTKIFDVLIGQEDVDFTIDLDSFLTVKPPAKDIYVTIGKNTTNNIIRFINSNVYNASDLTLSIVKDSSNGETSAITTREGGALHRTRKYTPATNFTGSDTIKYTISDGTTTSDEKTMYITVK